MAKIFVLLFIAIIALAGCNDKKFKLEGNVFVYQNANEKQYVGFDNEKVYLKWDDSLGVSTFQSEYTYKFVNDSTITIELKKKPDFWESNIWDIKVDKDKGFRTVKSNKLYKLSLDKIDKK